MTEKKAALAVRWLVLYALVAHTASACTGGAPKPAKTPKEAVERVVEGLKSDKPVVMWDSMPKSYRKDVDELVDRLAGKLDPELYDKFMSVAGTALKTLEEKKTLVLGSPAMNMAVTKGLDKEEFKKNYDLIVEQMRTFIDSDIRTVQGLKDLSIRKYLLSTGANLMKQSGPLAKMIDEDAMNQLEKIRVEAIGEVKDGRQTVRITGPDGKTEEVTFTKVEDYWVPEEMAEGWSEMVKKAKERIDGIDMMAMKVKTMAVLAMAESIIGQFAKANTQEEFNAAMMSLGQM